MEKSMVTGRLYDIQGFSVQDGPGIRTTAFLKGCPLRCPWCHSPESQSFEKQLSWMSMRCLGLEACSSRCMKACPKDAIEVGPDKTDVATGAILKTIHVKRDLCDDCGKCADACYAEALTLCGKDWTPENKALGQCSITAFLVQDIFGGDVYGIPLPDGGFHCYNVVDGHLFDLTSEQFAGETLCYENNPQQSRDIHFSKEEKYQRYKLLCNKLEMRK